nr:RHS domain-containing protein [Escherichia coli]
MDPVYTPARKIHLYHCDHRGLPLALISTEGATAWCAEYDEWGNLLRHAGAKNPPVPLRPSRPAAGAHQHGRGNSVVRRI